MTTNDGRRPNDAQPMTTNDGRRPNDAQPMTMNDGRRHNGVKPKTPHHATCNLKSGIWNFKFLQAHRSMICLSGD